MEVVEVIYDGQALVSGVLPAGWVVKYADWYGIGEDRPAVVLADPPLPYRAGVFVDRGGKPSWNVWGGQADRGGKCTSLDRALAKAEAALAEVQS